MTFADFLRTCGYLDARPLPDGRHYAAVAPFAFTHAIIVGRIGDCDGYENRWCYHSRAVAIAALAQWAGEAGTEPEGWHRHPSSGRRRPDGNPALEYIAA